MCPTEGTVAPIAVRVQMSNRDLQVATYRASDTNKSTQPSLWPLLSQERTLVQANGAHRLQRGRRSGYRSTPLWPLGPHQAAAALTARSLSSMGIRPGPPHPSTCLVRCFTRKGASWCPVRSLHDGRPVTAEQDPSATCPRTWSYRPRTRLIPVGFWSQWQSTD